MVIRGLVKTHTFDRMVPGNVVFAKEILAEETGILTISMSIPIGF